VQGDQNYETTVQNNDVVEKGGYSPRPQVHDLANLPNAPLGPPPGVSVEVAGTTAAANAQAPAGHVGTDSGHGADSD
jgi:hypothetical protein